MTLTSSSTAKANIPKKHLKLSKNKILVFFLFIIFLCMIAGIYKMEQKQNRKIQGVWIKAPYQKPKPSGTPVLSITPTINPTLKWKTYSNNSFRIKFPSRFSITDKQIPYSTLYPKIYSSIELTDGIDFINITVAKNTANFSLNSISGNGPYIRYANNLVKPETKSIIKINNTDSLITTRIPAGNKGLAKEILLINSNKVYQLTLFPLDNDTTTFDTMVNTFETLNQEPAEITENWKVYTNNYYGYTLKYPTNFEVEHERNVNPSTAEPALTAIYDADITSTNAGKFKIEAQDIRNITLSNITSRIYLGLPLNKYANKKWEYNTASNSSIMDNKISAIKETSVAGKTAYEFTVTNEYRDDRDKEKLPGEYIFYFTESGIYKYKIWMPKSDVTFSEILKTLTFTK